MRDGHADPPFPGAAQHHSPIGYQRPASPIRSRWQIAAARDIGTKRLQTIRVTWHPARRLRLLGGLSTTERITNTSASSHYNVVPSSTIYRPAGTDLGRCGSDIRKVLTSDTPATCERRQRGARRPSNDETSAYQQLFVGLALAYCPDSIC